MKAKFELGAVIVRKDCKDGKTPFLRDQMTIVSVEMDEYTVTPQAWYGCRDSRGNMFYGLTEIVDENFETL